MLLTVIAISAFAMLAYVYFMDISQIDYDGYFANILYGFDMLLDNPVIVGWIASIIVSTGGWLENYTQTGEPYDQSKFAETFIYYESILVLMSQAFPMPYAVFIVFGIDVARRIANRLRPKSA